MSNVVFDGGDIYKNKKIKKEVTRPRVWVYVRAGTCAGESYACRWMYEFITKHTRYTIYTSRGDYIYLSIYYYISRVTIGATGRRYAAGSYAFLRDVAVPFDARILLSFRHTPSTDLISNEKATRT